MIIKEITVKSEVGLHARTATRFVQCALQYQSMLRVEANGKKSNGKSLLGIMSLGIAHNDIVHMTAEGPDEAEMIDALTALNESNYE